MMTNSRCDHKFINDKLFFFKNISMCQPVKMVPVFVDNLPIKTDKNIVRFFNKIHDSLKELQDYTEKINIKRVENMWLLNAEKPTQIIAKNLDNYNKNTTTNLTELFQHFSEAI